MNSFERYSSPFSWRYASPEMRELWSEKNKRLIWRKIWLALAQAQAEYKLVTPTQLADLQAHLQEVDIPRALEIEAEIHHDLMAELRAYAEQCPMGGKILHLGATSMDIEDNADALRLREALDILLSRLRELLLGLAEKIDLWANLPIMALTHLQPAEPTSLGYRLAVYAQDLLADWHILTSLRGQLRGKGFKGAVGTAASYAELIGLQNLPAFEARLSALLGIAFFPVVGQTYPRKQEYQLISALAGLGASLSKFAFDLRILQNPSIGELSEPFGRQQVGSSAMPFKRNPIQAEKIDSLARSLSQMPAVAWGNAAHSLLERTLDDSANRRTLLPEAFLTADELLITARRILIGLQVNQAAIQRNLAVYGPFAGTERLLMALSTAGADRQAMHERLREHAMSAWQEVQQGNPNPLVDRLLSDPVLTAYVTPGQMTTLLAWDQYLGDAPQRAAGLALQIRIALA